MTLKYAGISECENVIDCRKPGARVGEYEVHIFDQTL